MFFFEQTFQTVLNGIDGAGRPNGGNYEHRQRDSAALCALCRLRGIRPRGRRAHDRYRGSQIPASWV